LGFLLWLKIMVKGQTTSYYATGGGLININSMQLTWKTAPLFPGS
jgi:hypothetical protein